MNESSRNTVQEVTKDQPCPHCGKPDWCYRLGDLSVCKRGVEPADGWFKTTKTDKEGSFYYAPIQIYKQTRPKSKKEFFYSDRDNRPLVKVLRIDDGQGNRNFYRFHWNGKQWVKGVPPEIAQRIPIYKYQQVREAIAAGSPVFMVEGEGCADALWDIGLVATTTFGGCKQYRSYGSYIQDLADANLILCPDRDEPGMLHMEQVAEDFPRAHWLYAPPGDFYWDHLASSGGLDVADWIADDRATAADILKAVQSKRRASPAKTNNLQPNSSVPNFALISPDELLTEIDQLIEQVPSNSALELKLQSLARSANRSTQDIKHLYLSRLTELEQQDYLDETKTEINTLLQIAQESLDLTNYLPQPLALPLHVLAQKMGMRSQVMLLVLLTGISSCHKVGTKLDVDFISNFSVPPNLFSVIVAESGQRKSPTLRVIVRNPLDELENEINTALEAEYKERLAEYRYLSEEEKKEQFPDGEPPAPAYVDYYFTNATTVAIKRQFARHPERGMLYLLDEFSALFGSYNQYTGGKGTERQDILSFFDGSGSKELRSEGFASRTVRTQLSVLGAIQPEVVKRAMGDCSDPDGHWARFLFVIQPLQRSYLSRGGGFTINISDVLNPLYRKVDQLPKTTYFLHPEAKAVFEPYREKINHLQITHPDPGMRAVYSKMEGMTARLALNLHVIHELFGHEKQFIGRDILQPQMVQAINLSWFFINQIKLLRTQGISSGTGSDLAPHLMAIVELAKRKDAVTARDIKTTIWAFRKTSTTDIRNYMQLLAQMGYGEIQGAGTKVQFCLLRKI